MSTKKRLFEAVGRVIWASQSFEFIFTIASKLAIKQVGATTLEEIVPLSLRKSFKEPVTKVLRDLSDSKLITEELAIRITTWAERRHKIVHRTLLEGGWPENDESSRLAALISECDVVFTDGNMLSAEFCDLLEAWLARFPDTEESITHVRAARAYLSTVIPR